MPGRSLGGLLVIEWFPYHSKKSALPPKAVCESQTYGPLRMRSVRSRSSCSPAAPRSCRCFAGRLHHRLHPNRTDRGHR